MPLFALKLLGAYRLGVEKLYGAAEACGIAAQVAKPGAVGNQGEVGYDVAHLKLPWLACGAVCHGNRCFPAVGVVEQQRVSALVSHGIGDIALFAHITQVEVVGCHGAHLSAAGVAVVVHIRVRVGGVGNVAVVQISLFEIGNALNGVSLMKHEFHRYRLA